MSLIEKEPIMKFIEDGLNNKHYGHVGVEIITEVEYAPTIDAVPVVHARWNKDAWNTYPNGFVCSGCSTGFLIPYPYCPNCGAKMDGDPDG